VVIADWYDDPGTAQWESGCYKDKVGLEMVKLSNGPLSPTELRSAPAFLPRNLESGPNCKLEAR